MNIIVLNEIKRLLENDQWQKAVELALEQEIVPQQEKLFTLQKELKTFYEQHQHYYKIGLMNQIDYLSDRDDNISALNLFLDELKGE
jgi:hypothetical protein